MPGFLYQARDAAGNAISGKIDAANEAAAADLLRQRSYIPIQIKPEPQNTSMAIDWQKLLHGKVKLDDLIIFSRQMYSLTKAGIPMIRAIQSLADSTSSVLLRKILTNIVSLLEEGNTLSAALATHPDTFNRLMVSLVHVGENTGRLDEAFLQLTYYFEQEQETRKQIKQATRYPVFVLSAIVIAMVVLNILVIPQFAAMFARFNAELPWSTRVLLASSDIFVRYWPFLLFGTLITAFLFIRWLRSPLGRLKWSRWKLSAPIIGNIINRATLGRFSRSFAMMLKAGVPMTSSLTLVAEAVDNDYLGDKIREMRRSIERGENLLKVAVQSKMFTPLVLQMIAVGEETGQMDDMLAEVAGFYEREVSYDLKGLTAKIEPILITVVAVMVAILALGIFTPMWDMLNAYQGG